MPRDPARVARKWRDRVAGSAQFYEEGVRNPERDWQQAALGAKAKRDAGLQRAIQGGLIDAGIRRAGTQKWQSRTIQKGVPNWQSAAVAAEADYAAGMSPVLQAVERAKAAIANLPDTTVEQRAERAKQFSLAMAKEMAALKQRA